MTDNQFTQLFELVTKCVNGIQTVQQDISELKQGQVRLEEGQAKLEADIAEVKKELQITNRALNDLAGESVRTKARIEILEQELSN